MIRPLTVVSFLAFAGAGAWLYHVKHGVSLQDRELREVRRATEQARERMTILRAEWSLLNEPDRLRQVATRNLQMEAMQPQHFARLNEMERRLPQVVAFAGAPSLFAAPPAPATPAAPAAPVMLASATAPVTRAQPAPAPTTQVAQPAAPRPDQLRVAEAPAPAALAAAIAAQRAEQAARAAAQPRPLPPPRPAATAPAPQPVAPSRPVQPAIHHAPPPEPVTRVARANVPDTTIPSALGGSALGRPMLAPPVPVGSAHAATLHGSGLAPPTPR